eukprot:scaffold2874_cov79-Skeletonema_marinoi.AAC.2
MQQYSANLTTHSVSAASVAAHRAAYARTQTLMSAADTLQISIQQVEQKILRAESTPGSHAQTNQKRARLHPSSSPPPPLANDHPLTSKTMRKVKEQPSSWSINDVSTWRSMPAKSASVARFENIDEVSKVSDSSEQSKDEQLSPTQLYSSLQDGHSSDTLKKTLQDILNPARIAALEACDVQPVPYDSYSFSSYIFTLKGRNLSMILSPLLALLLWGLGWQLLFMFLPKGDSYNE